VDRVAVAVALGTNLGDRAAHLDFASTRLRTILRDLRVSRYYETAPVGVGPQPMFLNAAAVGETDLEPRPLLEALLTIEEARGRSRPFSGAPRTLDLDLILYGSRVIDEPGLQVPHPRFRGRAFVLEPLADIAPGLTDPVTGLTVAALAAAIRAPSHRA
jgi:2-amino-4-hydroxy-6-hydroxymethyldihydropteridine diphosphokinase